MADDPLNLDEPGEWAGLWWLPEEPENKFPGVLRYLPNSRIELSLIGAFENRLMTHTSSGVVLVHSGSRTFDVIHGAAERREITLFDCHASNTSRSMGARVKTPDKQTLVASTALIGVHVSDEDEARFAAAEVSVEDLTLWASSSIFEATLGMPDGVPDGSGTISVKPIDSQSVTVDGTQFVLAHLHTLPFFDHRRSGTTGRVRDTAFVRIVPAEALSFRTALQSASLIQDLVALATHRAAGVIWLRLELVRDEQAPSDGRPLLRRKVDVLYSPPVSTERDADAADPRRVFFTCESLPFEQVVPRWVGAHQRLQSATNMIMGLRYAPARYIESNLLTAVGAAEVLHRRLSIDEAPMPTTEFKQMRAAMLEHVPEQHQDRFRGVIRNDPTLRDRLIALANRPDAEAISLLMPNLEHWAARTARARNDLAHEGETPRHSLEELVVIVEVTTAVVILNLLHELGLSAERQRELVGEHPQLSTTAERATELLAGPPAES
ncbi:MAG TPA: HEPN domain-containing protein [Pseudonocardiaceae bacterium]|nr:HEPN domain-containing protein [Pseudonocardiaceae bacterium]